MNQDASDQQTNKPLALLERVTAIVLVLVIVSLVWMIGTAYWPELGGSTSTEAQVASVTALLSTALVLVSAVALLQTRKK